MTRPPGDPPAGFMAVGHSFGGLAITVAAEATPDLIDRLVYLTAYVPAPDLSNAVALASLPEGQSSIRAPSSSAIHG